MVNSALNAIKAIENKEALKVGSKEYVKAKTLQVLFGIPGTRPQLKKNKDGAKFLMYLDQVKSMSNEPLN